MQITRESNLSNADSDSFVGEVGKGNIWNKFPDDAGAAGPTDHTSRSRALAHALAFILENNQAPFFPDVF